MIFSKTTAPENQIISIDLDPKYRGTKEKGDEP